jgi:chromosome segregation ATPase
MSTVEDELKDLKKKQAEVDAKIASANKTLQQTQTELSEANNQRASLLTKIAAKEKTATELGEAKDAGKTQREKVAKDLTDAQAAFDELQTKLNAELPAERRAAIAAAVAKVDATIDDARKTATTEKDKTAAAETAATDAKKKAVTAEAEYQRAGEELRQWPKNVEAARGQLTKLVADAKAALEAGRINEAYLKLLDLKELLATLPMISSQESENKVAAAYSDKGKASEAATSDAATATAALNKQKTTQTAAEAELKKKEQGRAADLKSAMSSLPSGIVESPAATGETPAAPPAGYQQP